ncbi:radical SAM protein [Clostridium tyrobutyricum]|uniref:Oxygen-independent coproporphyrinogen III oxidase, Fe-S oxidoreductase n=1 Tax=Clostridium tyrobutyricum DIVETGP TaxID=1408889 RepID=W6N379_CLOTY|nr:radical SAM protein [Clostridium tyrobutyricum]AND83993.1 methyltransferase [Clostridium tyrobutyricum]ANP68731.1 radical SAM protein [Clostridium tyrobutyricum]MBR9647148.1 B12-binding domain-containing radical SAM protein [Clostridium tyrobutyricum]MBV4415642.1 B12-binding domain-containing radical SAM protein [Clostridium tyrobutyricum]MBV4422284.1 B12-binding domain-containing radical SAM protein [Clostridium tyrobutyricum]
MNYEGIVYRPPSEAYSLIIQITIGCSHNKCTFCSMYKSKNFRIRNLEEIYADLYEAREIYGHVDRIFLADGDALILPVEKLKSILLKIKEVFPECKRVGSYAAPADILRKSYDNLVELKRLGLGILYMGIESGSDNILKQIQKGVTSREIIEAGKKVKSSGINLSVTFISGIGGKEKLKENARESAHVINEINPDYIGLLTLMVEPGTKMYNDIECGNFNVPNPEEIMLETRELIKNINVTNSIFRSNHASNYIALGGTLSKDRDKIIKLIDDALSGKYGYKPENLRRL